MNSLNTIAQKKEIKISYSKPDINSLEGETKPLANKGKDYPLSSLTHRDFERVIYSLYYQEITNSKIPFDSIALMSGIRDKAQDCVLYKNNVKTGLIQCKHSEINKPLNIKQCVEEIIKFLLYTIQENSLMPDINNFTYYFASSAGFDTKAGEYLRSFGNKIKAEANLEKWTKATIKKYSSINQNYEEIKGELKKLLVALVVKLIVPDDIQNLLSNYKAVTVRRFFEVQIVVDNSELDSIKADLKEIKNTSSKKLPDSKKLIIEFNDASLFLRNYKNSFSLLNPVKIQRKETAEIIQWIKNPLKDKEEAVLIIKGGAGSGKSVILSNVYDLLQADGLPTIALKADEINAANLEELDKKIGLSVPLLKSTEIIASEYFKVVIILDQLDALSQSLSANRDNLGTYNLLIEKLKRIPNVRIVISVREYDLNYDPYLIPFKKNTSFNVSSLSPDEVKTVLITLKVSSFSDKLIILLSTPLHLELFCQVYSKRNKDIKINSLYDLYNELWSIKVVKKGKKRLNLDLPKTLYAIASKIYEHQGSLSVNSVNFDADDIDYLKTEGLLLENNRKEVMFFHQTFYDYVFARQFVESTKNVTAYLDENYQGLFIRSCLKIILAHLREQNPAEYSKLLKELLFNNSVRFHIKQLILDYLGFIEEPIAVEQNIAGESIWDSKYEAVFYEAINSLKWVEYFIEKGWVSSYLNSTDTEQVNIVFQFFIRNVRTSGNAILEFLLSLPETESNSQMINRVLYFLDNWDEKAILLFERCKELMAKNPHQLCHCLEKAAAFNKDWVFNKFSDFLHGKASQLTRNQHDFPIDHSETELIKKLFVRHSEETFLLCKSVTEKIILQTQWKHLQGGLNEDGSFYFYSNSKGSLHGDDEFFKLFIDKIEENAINENSLFENLLSEYSHSNYASHLRLVMYGILANPKRYYKEAFTLLQFINSRNGFTGDDKLQYFVRQVVNKIYALVSYDDKKEINRMIENIKVSFENEVFVHPQTQKKMRRSFHGYYQYKFWLSVPQNELENFPDLFQKFQVLARKFGKVTDKEPNVITVSGSHPPYTKQSYEKMTFNDWINTFYKYNNSYEPDFFSHQGGIIEHGRAFEEQVSLRPDFFFPLVEQLIKNSKVSDDYKVYGINGLIKASYTPDAVCKLIQNIIKQPLNRHNTLFLIWSLDYLVKHKKIDAKIIDFLANEAINNADPRKDDLQNPLQRSINTVRGAAIDRLMKIEDKRFEKQLFSVLKNAIKKEKTLAVKSSIILNSAYLLSINEIKAFNIFSSVLKSDKRLIHQAMWSAEYFSYRYFTKMGFFFELAINETKVFKDLSNMLCKLFLRNVPNTEKYLLPLLKKSKVAKAEAIRVSVHPKNLINSDKTLNERCVKLFEAGLNNSDDNIVHQYSVSFLHFEPEIFDSIYPLLCKYSKSKAFKNSPAYFCKYVTKCCNKSTVQKCLALVSSLTTLTKTDITKGNYYESEPLNLVLAIYNTLGNSNTEKIAKEKCMDIFDKMLQQSQHRRAASVAIQLVDV